MLAVFKKELKTYFFTLSGWVFLAVFLLISGALFAIQMVFPGNSEYSGFLAGLLFIYLFVIPLLTMRIFTDEVRFRTDQLLLTGPLSLWGIVLGKYLAALSVYLITVIITILYPVLLSFHGKLDWPVIAGTYVGLILLGGAFIAIGIFISQISEGVVSAAVLTFCAIIVTFIIDFLRPNMPVSELSGLIWIAMLLGIFLFWLYTSGKNTVITLAAALLFTLILLTVWFVSRSVFFGLIGKSLSWLSLTRRFVSFPMGVLKLNAILYYLSFSGFFVFLTVQSLEKRRWS